VNYGGRSDENSTLARASRQFPCFPIHHAFFSHSSFHRVPLGFVCGYPLNGGELYGGSMYISSAATDTLQGQAMQKVNTRWGDDGSQPKGRESLAGPVCKKKYKPFLFRLVQVSSDGIVVESKEREATLKTNNKKRPRTAPSLTTLTWQVQVERLYGCACHHELRRQVILKFGERPGWEPFGQWSLQKALTRAKQETKRLNALASSKGDASHLDSDDVSTEESTVSVGRGAKKALVATAMPPTIKLLPLCANGDCIWKVKTAYDDIFEEIHESIVRE
jgi:hypothetical protein